MNKPRQHRDRLIQHSRHKYLSTSVLYETVMTVFHQSLLWLWHSTKHTHILSALE